MNFEQFVHSIPAWLSGEGPESGIVISSRARLARNIRGIVYAHRADDEQLAEVVGYVLDAAQFAGYDSTALFDATGKQVSPTFGAYNSSRTPRIIAFTLRFQF